MMMTPFRSETKVCAICGLSEESTPGPWIRVRELCIPSQPLGWVCSREFFYGAPACKTELGESTREGTLEIVQ